MTIPTKLTDRRAELLLQAEDLFREHRTIDARLAEIDFAIAACADCAGSAEAGDMQREVSRGFMAAKLGAIQRAPEREEDGVTSVGLSEPKTPGAESASAGEFELICPGCGDVSRQTFILDEYVCGNCDRLFHATVPRNAIAPKKPRAPKRDIRGMVLEYVKGRPGQTSWSETPADIAAALAVPLHAVEKAVAYWQDKERVTLAGGVVLLRTKQPDPDPVELNDYGRPLPEAIASEDGIAYGRGGLLAFLQAEPDSNMAEINAAGIPADEVNRAMVDGAIWVKADGVYALPEAEAQQSEAAE